MFTISPNSKVHPSKQRYQKATYRTVNVRVDAFAEMTALAHELGIPFTKLIKEMLVAYKDKLAREAIGEYT